MAEFRRLISYIYEYEGNTKGKNVGFVKLEARNGMCRLNVNVKKLYMGGSDMGVYLMTGRQEIFLGNIFLRNGNGDFRAAVQVADVESSGETMDACYGLTLHEKGDAWRTYTTIWEDAVTQAAQIVLEPVTSERVLEEEVEKKSLSAVVPDIPEAPETGLPSFEMGRLELETGQPDEPTAEAPCPEQQSTPPVQPVIRHFKEPPLIIGDPEALAKLDAEEAVEKRMPIWDFLLKTYPKIQAFDSEHGCQVLVIKPQDIGMLPREIWIYGNNSFLLHGYYNYRYLILARLENPAGNPRYLLGVPGHYYSNEKYMASMFGFPHFVLSKNQPAQDGRFGYWYADVRLDEE
ncbi:MAG: DUF6128 domain-containing protein [Lachnospiraceae bacterium]|nr:DUF6128 domain-containing protein [Lachnospiraceae bacterium]